MVPNRNPSPSRALAVAAIVAFVVPLGACSDPPDSSGAGSNSAVSSVHEVPPGYVRAEQAGLLIKIPERWTPLDVHDAMVDPDAVAPEVKRLASERSLTIEQYVSMLRGQTWYFSVPPRMGKQPLSTLSRTPGRSPCRLQRRSAKSSSRSGLPHPVPASPRQRVWVVRSGLQYPALLHRRLPCSFSALGPNGLVTLTASGASVAEAKRCAMRITSQMVSWTGS